MRGLFRKMQFWKKTEDGEGKTEENGGGGGGDDGGGDGSTPGIGEPPLKPAPA